MAAVAKHKECSVSNIAAVLLMHGLKLLNNGGVELDKYKAPSHAPRFETVLEIPDDELAFLRTPEFLNKFRSEDEQSDPG